VQTLGQQAQQLRAGHLLDLVSSLCFPGKTSIRSSAICLPLAVLP
jgi:hypothetical protein